MFSRQKSIIGIDLGPAFLKAVVLDFDPKKKAVSISGWSILDLRGEKDRPLEETLTALLKSLKTRCRDCAVTLWPAEGIVRFFDHAAPPDLVGELLKENSFRLFQQDFRDFVFGFSELPAASVPGQSLRSYVCCGMPGGEFSALSSGFAKAKLKIKVLQLSPLAVFNAFEVSRLETANRTSYLVVDIGGELTTIVGGRCGRLRLARSIPWGFNALVETLILEGGIGSEEELATLAEDDGINFETIRRNVSALAKEIVSSVNYLQSQEEGPDGVYLSGAANDRPAIRQILEEEIQAQLGFSRDSADPGIGLTPWNPLEGVRTARKAAPGDRPPESHSTFSAAAGAAFQYLY